MKQIAVIAGGWSASRLDLRKVPGSVIAVNDSALYAPRVDIIVSMDRLWVENRFEQVSRFGKPTYVRRGNLRNVTAPIGEHVLEFDCDHTSTEMSDAYLTLNGTNSGMCALNLAYQRRPDRLLLIGFDGGLGPRGEKHWFPDYPWKSGGGSKPRTLERWDAQLAGLMSRCIAAGIETIRIVNPRQLESLCRAA